MQLVVVIGAVLLGSVQTPAQSDPATQLMTYKGVLDELQRVIDHTKNNVDVAISNQLESIKTKAIALLKEIEAIEKKTKTDVNDVLFTVSTGTHDLLAETRRLVRTTERSAFLDLNSTLVNSSRILSALPLVSVQPYLAATEPLRLTPRAFDKRVYFYGYFPDVSVSDTASAKVEGKVYPLTVYAGNRLGFDLPMSSLKEESFIDMTITIPHRKFWKLLKKDIVISERIYVERERPFSVAVKTFVQNPDLVARVSPPSPFRASANSDITSVVRDITAKDLFSVLMPDAASFDLESVEFSDVQHSLGGGRPCDHAPMGSEFRGWDRASVRFSLTAGSVGPHWHSTQDCHQTLFGKVCIPGGFLHGGGGSHADIEIRPTFSVHKRNAAEWLPAPPSVIELAYRDTRAQGLDVGPTWRFTQVVASFRDGSEQWNEQITLFPGHESDSKTAWSAQVVGGQLTIQTR